MKEWKEKNLAEICSSITYGYTASASDEPIGPKFLRITDIVPERINWSTVPYCPISEKDHAKYQLQIGDIVIARTGATTGFNKVIKDEVDAVYASYLIRYQIDPAYANPFFVSHILRSNNWFDYVDAIAGGSAQPGANAKQFGEYELLLPPIQEQKAIEEVLTSLDDKVDILHKQNQKLEELAEILYRQWFIAEADPDGDEVFLSDVSDHHKKNIKPFENPFQEYFHYSIPAFDDGQNPQIEVGSAILSNKYQVLTNSILISKLNPRFPRVWQISKPIDEEVSICSTEFQVVVPQEQRWFPFIYYFLKSRPVTDELIGAAGGTSGSHQRVSPDDIFNLSFIKPDDNKLSQFHQIVSPNLEKINNNREQILKLEKLRNTLLPKLMSGEVRVKM